MIKSNLHHFQNPGLILLALAVALSFGLGYNSGNQNTYLLAGNILLDPNFLLGDWLAHETIHYHENFSYLVWGLESLGLPPGHALVLFDLILKLVFLRYPYKLTRLCANNLSAVTFLLVMILLVIEQTRSVAGSYIFENILQPSSLGALFTFIGVYYFVAGRYVLSGFALAVAGFFHTNFLLLSFVIFGLAHVFMGGKLFIRRCFLQFSPMVVVLAMTLPFLLRMMSAENADVATSIFQFVRSPHHYNPSTFLLEFVIFTGWIVIGVVSLYQLNIDYKFKNPILYLYGSMIAVLYISSILSTIVFIPWVSKLFFWRLAPYSVLLSQIFFACLLSRYLLTDVGERIKKPRLSLLILLFGEALILVWAGLEYGVWSLRFMALFAFVLYSLITFLQNFFVSRAITPKIQDKLIKLYLATGLCAALFMSFDSFLERSTFLNVYPDEDLTKLYAWVKTTPSNTTFVVPPNWGNFRLKAHRPIVVDWKSTPIDPEGLLEWHRRIGDISGISYVKSRRQAIEGYQEMDIHRLRLLKDKYNVDYVIVENSGLSLLAPLVVSYAGEEYSILEVPSQ